jgi:RNA recognition motif-containing protein
MSCAKLFVANLSWSVTERDLKDLFGEYGDVIAVKIPLRKEDGKPRGFAFVEMASVEAATQAQAKLNQLPYKGRPLAVNFQEERAREDRPTRSDDRPGRPTTDRPARYEERGRTPSDRGRYEARGRQDDRDGGRPRPPYPAPDLRPQGNNQLFVRHVYSTVDEADLRTFFEMVGPVRHVKLLSEKGLAFVTMATPDDAQRAVTSLHGSLLHGQEVAVCINEKAAENQANAPQQKRIV